MMKPRGDAEVEAQLVLAYDVSRELQALSLRLTQAAEDAARSLGIEIPKGDSHAGDNEGTSR